MYGYLTNQIGERRSPVAQQWLLSKWLLSNQKYFEGETLQIVMMSQDEWLNDDYPGHWVDDSGGYQN